MHIPDHDKIHDAFSLIIEKDLGRIAPQIRNSQGVIEARPSAAHQGLCKRPLTTGMLRSSLRYFGTRHANSQEPKLATIATGGTLVAIRNGLVQASTDFVRRNGSRRILSITLAAYAALWMLYFSVSHATVDIHFDLSEASIWAQTFAFGYKHPPMTAWIFHAWFAIFPRTDWAAHLLATVNITVTLAVTWVILRDHLDKERALVGVTALILVPFYTFQAARFNANTVMMPFWAATVLFYLRARSNGRWTDAVLAGAFAGLTFLGKYWGVYLIAGIAFASLAGDDVRRFWRSGAPFLMAAAALAVLAPHIHWLLTERDHATEQFLTTSVMAPASFGAALKTSTFYLGGIIGYVAIPLIFFAVLKPDRAALRDTIWPADPGRRQALLLLVVPLVLPAVANLAWPHRLTPLWTFPNWALLPVVLFGSLRLNVTAIAAARACLTALLVSLLAVAVSPLVAHMKLARQTTQNAHYRQIAMEIVHLAKSPAVVIGGSEEIVAGVFYYLPKARPMSSEPNEVLTKLSTTARVLVCTENDVPCRVKADSLAGDSGSVSNVTFTKTFLGYSSPPLTYRIVVAGADRS
jgi:4-amino-4-deoxy-L-arabinose transferase-like glycosyltransferase